MSNLAPRAARLALLVSICVLSILLAACGRKGPVRPPLAALPAAPAEARIDQQGDDFLLSWTIPERNEDGGAAQDLVGFRLYRMVYNAADGCPTCRDPEELVAAIMLNRPEPAMRIAKRIYWRDSAVAPGTGHAYLIVPLTIGGHEGRGTGVHRGWQTPPPTPEALRAEAGEGQVRLAWQAPAAMPAGQTLLGYNLYRRRDPGNYPPVALNAEPLKEAELIDRIGEAGRPAAYRVTTVAQSGDQRLESTPAAEVTAVPQGGR